MRTLRRSEGDHDWSRLRPVGDWAPETFILPYPTRIVVENYSSITNNGEEARSDERSNELVIWTQKLSAIIFQILLTSAN